MGHRLVPAGCPKDTRPVSGGFLKFCALFFPKQSVNWTPFSCLNGTTIKRDLSPLPRPPDCLRGEHNGRDQTPFPHSVSPILFSTRLQQLPVTCSELYPMLVSDTSITHWQRKSLCISLPISLFFLFFSLSLSLYLETPFLGGGCWGGGGWGGSVNTCSQVGQSC